MQDRHTSGREAASFNSFFFNPVSVLISVESVFSIDSVGVGVFVECREMESDEACVGCWLGGGRS